MIKITEKEKIISKLSELFQYSKNNKEINEETLRSKFYKKEILELLDYSDENIFLEQRLSTGKRTDIHCTDEYGNVVFVIEFKKPSTRNLSEHRKQLWKNYMKPLRTGYGLLYNGIELIFYERIGDEYNRIFRVRGNELDETRAGKLLNKLKKPDYDTTEIEKVTSYFEKFQKAEERLNLEDEASREHFFQNFQLKEKSAFGNLLKRTITLFEELYGQSKFLDSAYSFWKRAYAKKPDKVPKDWKPLMENSDLGDSKEDLYKFMFCLETSYALFARTILAKSGEDYGFPDIKFSDFIRTEIDRASLRGDIPQAAYAKMTQDLIADMRRRLVSSVFEEDIFYWWTEPSKINHIMNSSNQHIQCPDSDRHWPKSC